MFRIERPSLLGEIWEATQKRSVLLTGSPGSGKSWAVAQFIRKCRAAKRPVLPLVAEDLEARSIEDISTVLGLKKDPWTFLQNLGEGAVLVIDGLDALRAERSQRPFRELISLITTTLPQCALVVSIRTFDLQQSAELQRLFIAPRDVSTERGFKQIAVQSLSDADMTEAAKQVQGLNMLLMRASGDVLEMLRNPFNLHLAVRLLEQGTSSADLSAFHTQAQLLEAYWRVRVERAGDGPDRRAVLRRLLRKMIESNALSVPEEVAYESGLASLFSTLQSEELLRLSATGRISFSHNILFDYAVARLLLDEASVFQFIDEDPSRTIFFRPSLSFFFHHLWCNDRNLFWSVAFQFIESPSVPPRAQIIPAVALYEVAQQLPDFDALLNTDDGGRKVRIAMVLRALQAFGGLQSKRRPLFLLLLKALISSLDLQFVNEYVALVVAASEGFSSGDENTIGTIARILLRWMWNPGSPLQPMDQAQLADLGAIKVLPVILRFYDSDSEETRRIILSVLDRCTQSQAAPHEAYSLTQGIQAIVDHDPTLAVQVYRRLFGYREMSEAKTLMGGSRVLMFTSTRSQDYSMALYGLQTGFKYFLEAAPTQAALAAATSVDAELEIEKPDQPIADEIFSFPLGGRTARYVADHSEIWDSGGSEHISLTLFDAALQHAAQRLSDRPGDHMAEEIIETMTRHSERGVAWKHIVEAAALNPQVFFRFVSPCLSVPQFVSAPETTVAVGNLLNAAYTQRVVSEVDADRIEQCIMAIPSAQIIVRYEKAESIRDRLLTCIPQQELRSADLKSRAGELVNSNEARENKPFFQSHFGSVSPDQWLRFQGIDPEAPENARVLGLAKPLEEFDLKYANAIPDTEECVAVESLIRGLNSLSAELAPDHKLAVRARGATCSAAKTVLKNAALPHDGALFELCRKIVLHCASDPIPQFDPEHDLSFDRPAWSTGLPRLEAAQGLSHILWNWGLDTEISAALTTLSQDQVPAVRLQVAERLLGFYKHHATQQFWELAGRMMESERTIGVTLALVSMLGRVAGENSKRVLSLLEIAAKRSLTSNRSGELGGAVLDILVGLWIVRNDPDARAQLAILEQDGVKYRDLIGQAVFRLAQYIRPEVTELNQRSRARVALEAFVNAVHKSLAVLEPDLESESSRESFFDLLRLLEDVAFRLYVALGIDPGLTKRSTLDSASQRVLYFELKPIIELLTFRSGFPGKHYLTARAADLLLKTLDVVLPHDPVPIVSYVAAVCRASSPMGYQFDQIAIAQVVKFVKHVLADHKEILQDLETARGLGDTLDIFVRAGWPEAVQLVFTIDEAVR
jgi:hypothetical protein